MKRAIVTAYKGKGGWRWQMKDALNGKIIGASTEGYKNLGDMLDNFRRVTALTDVAFSGAPGTGEFAMIVDR